MNSTFAQKLLAKNFLWISLTLIFVLVALTLLQLNLNYRNQIIQLKKQEKQLVNNAETKNNFSKTPATHLEIEGLKNPVEDLTDDLLKHPELIPYKGVLGGKMGFHSRSNIQILNSKWAIANFDDGHISGTMLLEYTVSKNGKINWKVIRSFLL